MATRWFIFLSVILWGADQLTKTLARRLVTAEDLQRLLNTEIGAVRNEIIPGFFHLTLNFNKGIAWGMLPEWSEYFTYFAIIMVLVILMIMRKLERDEVWLKIALALQMAGALGNMTDRLVFHRVTDFIDVTLFAPGTSWTYDWPIFNLADSFVVIGTIILVTVLIFSKDPEPESTLEFTLAGARSTYNVKESEDDPRPSLPPDEALIELPIEEDGMLEPFEELGKTSEFLPDALGFPDEKIDPSEETSSEKSDKLDEFRQNI